MSQNMAILNHLQSGNSLTSLEALNRFGCMRLASRVDDLHKMGYAIEKRNKILPNRKVVAEYFLNQELEMEIERFEPI